MLKRNIEIPPVDEDAVNEVPIEEVQLETGTNSEESAHLRAVELADAGGYANALERLKDEGLLSGEVGRIQETCREALEDAVWMTEADWEMLAVLHCFDEKTALHCVNTYRIAKAKIEEITLSGHHMSELVGREGVTLEQFYRACLFHDIGKCCIPRATLNNTLHDDDWDEHLCEEVLENKNATLIEKMRARLGDLPPIEEGREGLLAYLKDHHERAMHFVPLASVVGEEELARIVETFPDIDPREHTLADVIAKHEHVSGEILTAIGLDVEGELASQHHNYDHAPLKYPMSGMTLSLSAKWEELLKLADMTQALSSRRAYKEGWSIPIVCETLIEEVKRGDVTNILAALWIKNEFSHMDASEYGEEDLAALGRVQQFLDVMEPLLEEAAKEIEQEDASMASLAAHDEAVPA